MVINMMDQFLEELASKAPVPGGGGASALVGAIGAALCSMVANLTDGKKTYSQYQDRIDKLLPFLENMREELVADIKMDADAFYPLSQAYSLKKDAPNRDQIMEEALLTASNAPMKIVEDISKLVPVLEELEVIGSRLALSDVAVAASVSSAALKGAVMNIYINTRSMKDRKMAASMNQKAKALVEDGTKRCDAVYAKIAAEMI